MNRRTFIRLAAVGALAPRVVLARMGGTVPPTQRRMLQLNGYAIDAETPLDALTTYLTPTDLFFVRHHWEPSPPNPETWHLTVDGEVTRPLTLRLADLRQLPVVTVTCILQCAGNGRRFYRPAVAGVQWSYGAVGNARWTGVRVKDLLEQAGVRSAARHLHTFGTDTPPGKVPPFHRSVDIEKACADGIIAYEMNGEPLPALHGGPARLVIPGWAGEHWMKWLDRISAQPQPQTGFYMDVAYRYPIKPGAPGVPFNPEEMKSVSELFVKSNFTEAPAHAAIGSTVTLRGFAFSGAPDIATVEVSDDDGATWRQARLDPEHDPYAWRLWAIEWRPSRSGRTRLLARATDSRGSIQPRDAVWNQSGYLYNAWHAVEIEVSA